MSLRLFWRRFHLWIGGTAGLFLLAITISGILLMFEDKVGRWLNPSLYAVTGPEVSLPVEVYLARAREAVPNADPAQFRWPEAEGSPVMIAMRLKDASRQRGAEGPSSADRPQGEPRGERGQMGAGRPRVMFVYLDPPTARVLGINDPRSSVIGLIHSLHTDLLMPAFSGRQIVGWVGAGLLILCMSGLYLWWPRNTGFLRGLQWRRGAVVSLNLHRTWGFWIVIPLGIVACTGMILAFPQQSRALMGMIVPTDKQSNRNGNGPLSQADLSPQQAIDLALSEAVGFHVTSLALPSEPAKAWWVQVANAAGASRIFLVDDATKRVTSPPEPLQGDAILSFLRRIHEGHHDGPIWETIVFLAGASPPLLFVTGILMWLRRRRIVKPMAAGEADISLQKVAIN